MPEAILECLGGSVVLVLPEVVLLIAACLFFLGAGWSSFRRYFWAEQALAAVAIAGCVFLATAGPQGMTLPEAGLIASLFRNDAFAALARGLGLAAGFVLILISRYQAGSKHEAEYYACLLVIIAGVNLVASANDLISLFLALELVSIPTYVILYLPRHDTATQEAAVKYFLLSIFSSGLLLYGLSFVYGVVGATNLEVLRAAFRQPDAGTAAGLLGVGLVLIVAGLGFRVTAAPFHFYAPDVYQGVPAVGAALLAVVPKIAGFVALYQVVTTTILSQGTDAILGVHAGALVWIIALVSMFVGNLMGLLQNNLKRLLAYSGIAHAGYMLVGLGAGYPANADVSGITALFFYLIVYAAMTAGAFAVIIYLDEPNRPVETVDDLSGLAQSHPLTALMMALFLFSLTGLPPAAGFWGKLMLLYAAWSTNSGLYRILAVAMAINAAIGAYYYLRIVSVMYLRQPVKPLAVPKARPVMAAVVVCALVTVGLFVRPSWVWRPVEEATTPSAPTGPAATVAMARER